MKSRKELLTLIHRVLDSSEIAKGSSVKPGDVFRWFSDGKTIRDSVHDQITLNEIERAVISTGEMQRLRWVHQMDFAYLVYPAAEHSRFIHSLGVCHCAKELFDRVMANTARNTQESDLTKRERAGLEDFALFDRVLVGLAGLLHDLPHTPFSHAFDARSDLMEHDDFERNPFLLRALFDERNSELARVLKNWDPWFRVLVNAEFRNDIEESTINIPSLAFLVFELLATKSDDDSGDIIKCLVPGETREAPYSPIDFETLIRPKTGGEVKVGSAFDGEKWGQVKVMASPLYRRLHADIVANTISADLMDYIRRDTMSAGIPRAIDRRFYSYIQSAKYRNKQRVVVELKDRQGHVRRDVLSDLMSCMEARYLIHERIVLHRAVVSARSMAARLFDVKTEGKSLAEMSKMLYGPWGQWKTDSTLLSKDDDANSVIAGLLRTRRLYRPIVILDCELARRSSVTLSEDMRSRLAAKFGGVAADKRDKSPELWSRLTALERKINTEMIEQFENDTRRRVSEIIGNACASFASCMKSGVMFKNPRVLVRVPTSLRPKPGSEVEDLESWVDQVIPLGAHEGDQAIYAQIKSLNTRYNELWRLYVFAHPGLFDDPVGQVYLGKLKTAWEREIAAEASIDSIPNNVSASDLGPNGVLPRGESVEFAMCLSAVYEKFPEMSLPAVQVMLHEVLNEHDCSAPDLLSCVKSVAAEAASEGVAAKGGTASKKGEKSLFPERTASDLKEQLLKALKDKLKGRPE